MLDNSIPKPLHQQLEEIIKGKINSDEWAPGTMIPSENKMSSEYGLSRSTVRAVLSKLVQEELLFRIPGKGTYVAEPKIEAKALSYAGIREQLEQMGYEVSTRILDFAVEKGSANMCRTFSLDYGAEFYMIRRLRYVKSEPLSLHTSYIPVSLCPDLQSKNLVDMQLCTVLGNQYGLNHEVSTETLESVAATKYESQLLNIPAGHPLLLLTDVISNSEGTTFEYSKVVFRGDRIKIRLTF